MTAGDIVKRALRLLGVIASGESVAASEQTDGLTALNAMIGSWQTEKLIPYFDNQLTLAVTSGDADYTLGTGGDNATRPTRIEYMYATIGGVDYTISQINGEEYASIDSKTSTGIPEYYYYNPAYPQGVLYLYPVPAGSYNVTIGIGNILPTFTAVTTIALPPGYEDALAYNLAVRIAPEYGVEPSATVAITAQETKTNIKRLNIKTMVAGNEITSLASLNNDTFNIYYG